MKNAAYAIGKLNQLAGALLTLANNADLINAEKGLVVRAEWLESIGKEIGDIAAILMDELIGDKDT